MKPLKYLLTGVCALAILCGGFFAGRLTAEKPISWQDVTVFHAEILERDGARFHVNGLDCNDVNGRGEYTFSVGEDTPLLWRYEPIALEDLQPGDCVAVTYTGDVLETYPEQLTDVLRIELLDDEK